MFKFHDTMLKRAGHFLAILGCGLAFLTASTGTLRAQVPPPNDNLSNAQPIVGISGTINGINVSATAETNEPAPVVGNPAGASIWYIWTAPITTTISFNTRGSTDPNTGDDLDTVLAAYKLSSGTNLSMTNLTRLARNDDDPSGSVVSRIDFDVKTGTTYLIQVDGSTNGPGGVNAQGNIVLNWSPSLVAGAFGFSSSTYFAGEFDDIIPVDYSPNSISPSIVNKAGTNNVRITVSRLGGNTGRCTMTLLLTNTFYENIFITNLSGTNVFVTNFDLANNVINWTNSFFTNLGTEGLIENYIDVGGNADLVQQPLFSVSDILVSNDSTGFNFSIQTNAVLTGLGLTNYFTNFPFAHPLQTSTTVVTNTSSVTKTVTQIFSFFVTNISFTPTASNGVDYAVPVVTNITFDDFQMSKDIYLQVNPNNTIGVNVGGGVGFNNNSYGPDWPDANSNFTYYGVNSVLQLGLTNIVLDTNENLDILPPLLSTNFGSNSPIAFLDILRFGGNPNNYVGSPRYLTTNGALPTFATVNLERATFRVNRTTAVAYLYAIASNTRAETTYTFHYTIDCVGVDGAPVVPTSAFNDNGFNTVADSDYAQSDFDGVTVGADFSQPLNNPPDPSQYKVGGFSTWPSGAPFIGSFTIQAAPIAPLGVIAIPILNNGAVQFDMDMQVKIFETPADHTANQAVQSQGQPAPGELGNIRSANLTVNFSGVEPGGANDTSFNVDATPGSIPPNNPVPGANGGNVNAIAIQPNGQSVIGGYFSSYNTTPVYGIARLLTNGFLDANFNKVSLPGVNFGGFVQAIVIDPTGRIIIGGSFQSYDGVNAVNIARLNFDGSLDTTFNSGIGFDNIVYSLALDANGNILVGGAFTSYNATNCNRIARLLPNGGLDTTFLPDSGNGNPNLGADGEVRAIALDGNGNIILGGKFNFVNGSNLVSVARLSPSGAVDAGFNPEIGPDGPVYSIAIEPTSSSLHNEILLGGAFQNFNLLSRSGVVLLQTSGAVDTSFTPGAGADGTVYTVAIQPTDGNILVGGQFRNFNNSRRLGIARLLPQGWVDTSFMDTAYNQYAGLINHFSSDPVNIAYALAEQPDGNIMIGGSFTRVGGGGGRDDVHTKINVARLIGASNPGPQTGGGGAGNCPGNVTLTQNPYTIDDTAGKLFVTVDRVNGSLGEAAFTLGTNTLPSGPGSATAADFGLVLPDTPFYNIVYNHWEITPYGSYGWRQSDGYFGFNNNIQPPVSDFGDSAVNLTINNNKSALQNLFAGISELNINSHDLLLLGGVSIPTYPSAGLPSASLEIINDNFPPGDIGFAVTNFTALDTSNAVTITLVRTNGTYGPISVYYYTGNGTAIAGSNYTAVGTKANPAGPLTFPGGTNNTVTFTIPIIKQSTVQNTKSFKLFLENGNPSGVFDTNLPPILATNATVTIIDGNFVAGHLSFTSPTYSALKGGLASVNVQRIGGALGELSVQVGTTNGTATNGLNYAGFTNTLLWTNQDVSVKTVTFQTLQDNTVEGPTTVNVQLFNATNVGGSGNNSQILATPSNAVVTILDSDSYGNVNFAVPNFNILQNAGQALITVIRTNGATGTVTVNYATISSTNVLLPTVPAQAGTNYGATNGTLVFGPGVTSQSFTVPIYFTPGETNVANRVVTLELLGGTPGGVTNQFPSFATVTILDPQLVSFPAGSVDQTTQNGTGFNGVVDSLALQPDGKLLAGGAFTFFNQYPFNDVARLTAAGNFDSSFLFNQGGANGDVLQVLSQAPGAGQATGPIVMAGSFTQVDSVSRGGIARLNADGSVDETFNPGSGADNTIFALVPTSLPASVTNQPATLAFYIGGSFANFDGVPSGGIARLNASTNSPSYQGNVDPNFNVGQGVTGSNATVRAIAVQPNNQIVVGGDFTSFNSVTHNHLVRLNLDGSVDPSFNPDTGSDPGGSVRAIAIQSDGKIVIGGLFTNVNGVGLNHLARLNTDGTVDTNFTVGLGGDNSVLAIAIDSQQRILVGGEFARFSGVTRSGITRLNSDGSVDPTINFGSGADGGYVDTIVIQSNDEMDLGGGFATFEGLPENNFVRVYGGANSGDGTIQFSKGTYGVLQNGTNATITLQRLGGEGTATQPTVSVVFFTTDGTAVAGRDYVGVTNVVTFALGETFQTITVPIINGSQVSGDKSVNLNLSNPVFASIGALATAQLIITNINTAVSFSAPIYNQSEAAPGGNAIIPIVRTGYSQDTVAVTVYTGTNGTATPFTNYMPQSNVIVFTPGVLTNFFLVPVINASNMFSDQTVDLEMTSPSNAFLGSPSSATLIINSVNPGPGVLAFSMTNYVVSEGATNAAITIIRTNGSSGSVAVTLTTSNGTALAGINYSNVQITVNFASTEVSKTILIPLTQLATAGPDTTVYLTLSNPQPPANLGGPTIGGSGTAILTIQNDIQNFSFANSPYVISEGAGTVSISVVRAGPFSNSASVSYTTFSPPNASESNGYAVPGVDYVPASGILNFGPNSATATFPVTILQGNTVNAPLTFQVLLDNPTPAGVQVGIPGTAPVTILSDVTGFSFSTNAYSVGENGTNVLISVTRLNPNTGAASVQYNTVDGTALNQVDYITNSGTLNFANGQSSNGFIITIPNQNLVENNKTFTVSLSNPKVLSFPNPSTNAYLVSPSNAIVRITNVLSGITFASSTFTASECGGQAPIVVLRTGATNSLVSVTFTTTNGGSGVPGANYTPLTTNLVFQPGQTSLTNFIQLNDDSIIGPDHTVFLALANPQGAQLVSPSTAVLTIQECDGAFIVKSGTAWVSGSQLPSGVIMPNETVSILFGLRDIAGRNTTNLVGTLLATNGITNITAGTNNYGALVTGGPTVSRGYTFKVLGTNGQNVSAVLTLMDGSQVYSNVIFGFTVGGTSTTFGTNEFLTLVGSNSPPTSPPSKASSTNAPNFGYPSTVGVVGISGNVTAITATLSNVSHAFPKDIAAVLESPLGQFTYLMAGAGTNDAIQNVTLSFSQSASANLPQLSAITPGTYLPTEYGNPLLPGITGSQKIGPFPASLTNFNGQSPNGTWSLLVADEDSLDGGSIGGWSLNISTGIPVEEDSDLEMVMNTTPSAATLSNVLIYTISVTNYGPAIATNVIITDTLPLGATYVTNGLIPTNGVLVYNAGTLAVSNGVTFTVSVIPGSVGFITNTAVATSIEPDPNSNNVQSSVTLVSPASADLSVALSSTPNPVIDGGNVTYTVVVTNRGPSSSTGITAVNVLPAGFIPSTITASQGTVTNVNGTITWSIGSLGSVSNSGASLTILTTVNLPENTLPSSANLDTVSISSQVFDPTKLNNFASIKTQVDPSMLSVTQNASTFTLSWPMMGGHVTLQGAITLSGPWVPITNSSVVQVVSGGVTNDTFTLPGTNGYHYFRLATQTP